MEITITKTQQLKKYISEVTFTDIEQIKEDTLLFEEGIFDSLGFLSLISYIQEEYEIEIEDDDLKEENFQSIKAVVTFIGKKRNNHKF